MKHILLGIFIALNFINSYSQEANSITVVGESVYEVNKNKTYIVNLQLKELKSDGYTSVEGKPLEQVINEYKVKLKENNINFNDFIENNKLFIYSGYNETNHSIYYTFKTTSEQEMKKFLKIKMIGLMIMNVEIISDKLSLDELSEMSFKAIENAREKAEIIAKKINKKIGEINSIYDQNQSPVMIDYYNSSNSTYTVTVNFKLL